MAHVGRRLFISTKAGSTDHRQLTGRFLSAAVGNLGKRVYVALRPLLSSRVSSVFSVTRCHNVWLLDAECDSCAAGVAVQIIPRHVYSLGSCILSVVYPMCGQRCTL